MLQKMVVSASSDTGIERHKVVNYTTEVILTKGIQDNIGHMQLNK